MPLEVFRDQIRVAVKGVEEIEKKFNKMPDALKQALENAIKRTAAYTKEEIPALITHRYDITEGSLMDQSHRAKFQMRAKYVRKGEYVVDGGVVVTGHRLPVMRFNVNPKYVPKQRGIPVHARQIVTVSTVRGHAQHGVPNLFLARMRSGHLGVFRRKPDATHRIRPDGQRTALNITEEHMISVPEMIQGKHIRSKLEPRIRKFYNKAFLEETQGQKWRFRG